jgi:hypothetical protein
MLPPKDARLLQFEEVFKKYIPEAAVDTAAQWVLQFRFHLKITASRSTKLGDYSTPHLKGIHYITVNHNLNKYAFFITYVHEVAHLVTYEQYKAVRPRVKPHGKEWKRNFKNLIWPFLNENVFPPEVLHTLKKYMNDPAASSCSDADLQRVLKRYDANNHLKLLEDFPMHAIFEINGRKFKKGKLLRKRFECMEVTSKRMYLVSNIAEVKEVEHFE